MKRSLISLAVLALCAMLAACASPNNASITNGKIDNINGAQATTLAKQSNRTKRVEDVQKNAKPIFKVTAQPGQTIAFTGVQSIEVNVPIDPALLMSEQADVVSENVQMFDRVTRFGEKVAVPLGLAKMFSDNLKDSRASELEAARVMSAERGAQNASQAEFVRDVLNRPQGFITLPEGGSAGYLMPN